MGQLDSKRCCALSPSPTPTDEQAAGDRSPAGRGHSHLDALGDLPVTAFSPQLDTPLVEEPQPVEAAARGLTAVGVERTFAVEADPLAAFDVAPGLAVFAEPQGLDPLQRQVAESVVQLH